jgi:hypothetical protein
LAGKHKHEYFKVALSYLQEFKEEGNQFLKYIVTSDDMSASFHSSNKTS